MEILIIRDCEAEICVAKRLCCEDCGYTSVHEKVQLFMDEEYDVDNYSYGHITESGLASLEEGVDYVHKASYEAGKKAMEDELNKLKREQAGFDGSMFH